jgi:hypothetical protein
MLLRRASAAHDLDYRKPNSEVGDGLFNVIEGRVLNSEPLLVSIGKHLGMFVDVVRGEHAHHYGISDKEMTAEEWKRLHVTER